MNITDFLSFYCVFPFIVALGLFLTFKLKYFQLRHLKQSAKILFTKSREGQGNVSHYEAVSAVIAGNLGTGNISGMAVALSAGGPGALVWMWVMAFLGSIIQYASCFLGVKYREKTPSGEFVGGPMYYLKNGLGYRKLAIAFSLFTLFASICVGNFAQVNSALLPFERLGISPLLSGSVMMVVAGLTLLGGMTRIAVVAGAIVPVMALFYLGASVLILSLHIDQIVPAFKLMFQSAFHCSSFAGGALGFSVIKAISVGFERGLFATDAGTGIVPILQAGVKSQGKVIDGISTLIAPFFVMMICTVTGLVLLVTGAFEVTSLKSTDMVLFAFKNVFGSVFGGAIIMASIVLFAYTTIIAWGGCGEKVVEFLFGKKYSVAFRYCYLALIPVGAVARVDFVWMLADLAIALMLLINLIGVSGLAKEVITETKLGMENLLKE